MHTLGLITGGESSRDGKPLRSFPFNESLVSGPDFQLQGSTKLGKYLRAAVRYGGRFYVALGTDRLSALTNAPHHVLIVSGLYGLLTPSELIQCYSCHVPDHPDIAKRWTDNDLLSRIILAYIEAYGITKVFDFMAADAYRNLISWEMIRHATKGNVLHCFSKQYAGGALLPSLGQLVKEFFAASESTLQGLKPGDPWRIPDDEIVFQPFPVPDKPDIAREIHRQRIRLSSADKIGRMRRNIVTILHEIPDLYIDRDGFGESVAKLAHRGHAHDG